MYKADDRRYENMIYRRAGKTGLKLPLISLGLWHNFGDVTLIDTSRKMIHKAFDLGITHFDLANNYGPPAGSAEINFGRILKEDMKAYRDEMIISTKAGYTMWPGPYGDYGSRKYLISSLDQSLKRMGLDYVDIYYHHRPDPNTPVEETMLALDQVVKQGKALYVGISNYRSEQAEEALKILKELKTPVVMTQPSYSMLNRWIEEDGLLDVTHKHGIGNIVFSPLAQGVLSDKYLNGIPADSRVSSSSQFLNKNNLDSDKLDRVRRLNDIANNRGQSLAQMALSWVLRDDRVTTALIGASKVSQIEDSVKAINHIEFSEKELSEIDSILA
ncbi:L-glyceraldehyde 3-phosphate reductase [Clostridium grantii]|uniref:L-glyceraldehyde 3-phosphate reductase n=1 Tax=Clostridium grantii DSM 8605 TaxID=1121316 RepID=A0A1M5UAH8_9CLOT|nr:L-glyceraldehyde 3-phosphate reductase [Clostridium grantii]SHH60004.1 L-glyceraldehyde 3-phosphate reductase [Clostridium grantii DSM 8605]